MNIIKFYEINPELAAFVFIFVLVAVVFRGGPIEYISGQPFMPLSYLFSH